MCFGSLCFSSARDSLDGSAKLQEFHGKVLPYLKLKSPLSSETISNNWKPFKTMKNAFYFT